jgi:hypothetical protein
MVRRPAAFVVVVLLLTACSDSSGSRPASGSTLTSSSDGRGTLAVAANIDEGPPCQLNAIVFGYSAQQVTQPLSDTISCDFADVATMIGDFNFDGRLDVAVVNRVTATNGPIYDYWLQGSDHSFTPSSALSDADLVDPQFDAVTKEIRSTSKDGPDVHVTRMFTWSGSQLVEVGCTVDTVQPVVPAPHDCL